MEEIKGNGWYAEEFGVSKPLMNYYTGIDFIAEDNVVMYNLRIIDSDRRVLILRFYSFDETVGFVQEIVNNCKSFSEIMNEYKIMYDNGKSRGLRK
jgi:hypothetical protein